MIGTSLNKLHTVLFSRSTFCVTTCSNSPLWYSPVLMALLCLLGTLPTAVSNAWYYNSITKQTISYTASMTESSLIPSPSPFCPRGGRGIRGRGTGGRGTGGREIGGREIGGRGIKGAGEQGDKMIIKMMMMTT